MNNSESIGHLNKKNLHNYDPASFRQAKALRSRELFEKTYPGLQRISPEFFPEEMGHTFSCEFNNEFSHQSIPNKRILSVSISRLRKFLESPLQSTASHLLGIAEDQEEIEEKTDEPLELDRLSEWSVLRKIWDNSLKFLKTEHDWSLFYEFQTRRMMLEGKMPGGIFGEATQAKHIRILKCWQKKLISALETNCTAALPQALYIIYLWNGAGISSKSKSLT